jgi:hypothetical protein
VFAKRQGYYACLYKQGRISRLFDDGAGLNTRPKPRLKGAFVAYTSRGSAIGDEFDRVRVWNLRDARAVFTVNSTFVSDLALKANGSVAWTARSLVSTSTLNEPLFEVRRMSRQGDELVDRGTGIAPASLALWRNGRTISWTEDGRRQTSTLP